MKVAFLMQCHKNPEQINLLLEALNHPMVDVFVHVDKKSQAIKDKITQRAFTFFQSNNALMCNGRSTVRLKPHCNYLELL